MRNHISYRSGNPALQSSTFKNNEALESGHMTLEGTINKVSLSLLVLMCTAMYTWHNPSYPIMIFGAIGGFIVALITIFKKHLAVYTTLIYAALEGLFLGGISRYYDMQFGDGKVGQAIFITFSIFAVTPLVSPLIDTPIKLSRYRETGIPRKLFSTSTA